MHDTQDNKLTELQARVVELRDGEGLGFREIGERLGGRNQGNIHRIYTTAKKKLAREPRREELLAAYREQRGGKPVTDESLLEDIDATLAKALFLLRHNEAALAGTRPKDLMAVGDKLLGARQLLRGEPTSITRLEDVRKLDQVALELHREMERRGLLPDPVIDVEPAPDPEGSDPPEGK